MSKKNSQNTKLTVASYNNQMQPTWCPGCGNFGIQMALKQAMADLKLQRHKTFMVWGIGCSSNTANWFNAYTVHSLHGRALPVATGAKLANPNLTVVAAGGDGDGYGIGLNHFIQSCRRNLNITYIVHNNLIYGLTTGQTSPTSEKGFKTKSTPCGVIERPINPIALALSSDATYIARGFAGDVNHLKKLIANGIQHRGFALIDIFQPCVTFNKQNTYEFFREKIYKLQDNVILNNDSVILNSSEGSQDSSAAPQNDIQYDYTNKKAAYKKALEWGDKIPIGLFFKEDRKTYSDEIDQLGAGESIVEHAIDDIDVKKTLAEFV